jgi:hypothetical protein
MPAGRRKSPPKVHEWDKLGGVNCPTCHHEILRTFGPFKQCHSCFYKAKETFFEFTTCSKCTERAVKVTTLSDGLLDERVICPNCGTHR